MRQATDLKELALLAHDQAMYLRCVNNRLRDNNLENLLESLGKLSTDIYVETLGAEKLAEVMVGMESLVNKSWRLQEHMQEDVKRLEADASQLLQQANTEDNAECRERALGLLTKSCIEQDLVTYLSTTFINEMTTIKEQLSAGFG